MILKKKRYFSAGFCCRIISFFMVLNISPDIYTQPQLPQKKISVNAKNKTIIQILDDITLQTGLYFTFDASLIPAKVKKDFTISNLEIREALDSLLQTDDLSYVLIDKNIVIRRENKVKPSPDQSIPDHTIIRGTIRSARSGKPLPYATIALMNTHLGAISNQDGEFSFKLPVDLVEPLLVISFMGYKNLYFPVEYPLDEPVTIMLEQSMISLQEVIIRYQDPVSLIREALNRVPENYLSDHSRMTAFYRESVKRNEHCMILSEAVLEVAKGPYNNNVIADRVKIYRGRKILDVSVEDTIVLKIKSGIYTSLDLDIVKNLPDFLAGNFTELYSYDFSDIISYGNDLVYAITFYPRSHIEETLFKGTLYIDVESLAIVSADFRFDPEKIQREQGMFVVSKSRNINIRPISAEYHVDYRKLNGKYHISQVRADVELKIRKKRKWIGSKYLIGIELAITDVNPGERLRIESGERVKPNVVMSEESFEYDPLFWGVHNIIEPEASLEEALKSIGKSMQEYLQPAIGD